MLIAKNPYNNEFNSRVAFSCMVGPVDSFTCDRKEFLGRNGNPSRPAALGRSDLSG
jgi:cellobiose phosphorylase